MKNDLQPGQLIRIKSYFVTYYNDKFITVQEGEYAILLHQYSDKNTFTLAEADDLLINIEEFTEYLIIYHHQIFPLPIRYFEVV